MREPSLNKSALYLPDERFTYGRALRPSTPIRDVIGNFYGDVAEHLMHTRYDNFRKDSSIRLGSANRHTRASALAKSHVNAQLTSTGNKELFKMKKFDKVQPRTNTHKN